MSTFTKLLLTPILTIGYWLMADHQVHATPVPFSFAQPPQFSITSIGRFIGSLGSLLFIIAGILVFIYLAWGGIQWIQSGGDTQSIQAAQSRITAALIGLSVIALGLAITFLVQYFFGIDILENNVALPTGY